MQENKTNDDLYGKLWKVNMNLNYDNNEKEKDIDFHLPILNSKDYKYTSCEVIQVLNDNNNSSSLICDYILINSETNIYQYCLILAFIQNQDSYITEMVFEYNNLIEHEIQKINSTLLRYLIGCYSTEVYALFNQSSSQYEIHLVSDIPTNNISSLCKHENFLFYYNKEYIFQANLSGESNQSYYLYINNKSHSNFITTITDKPLKKIAGFYDESKKQFIYFYQYSNIIEYFTIPFEYFTQNYIINTDDSTICYEHQNYCKSNNYYYHSDIKACVLSKCRESYFNFYFECFKDNCPINSNVHLENQTLCESEYDYCYIDKFYKTNCSNYSNEEFPFRYENSKIYFNSCNDSLYFYNKKTYLYNNTCLSQCPYKTFPDDDNGICKYNYTYYLNTTSIIYNTSYEFETYLFLNQSEIIINDCYHSCSTCYLNKSQSNEENHNCIDCQHTYYHLKNTSLCFTKEQVESNHSNWYFNQEYNAYDFCHPACKTCIGPSEHNCTSYYSIIDKTTRYGYTFDIENNTLKISENTFNILNAWEIEESTSEIENNTLKISENTFNILNAWEIKENTYVFENDKKNIMNSSWTEFKNLFLKNITAFLNSSNIIQGSNFIAIVLSSDNMDPKEQLEKGISAVDLGNCTEIIKDYYNISKEENLIVLNTEIKNSEIGNNSNFNLGKNIQLEIFDYSGRKLELSVCKEDIKLMMNLKDTENELDIKSAQTFSEQNIDIFNAKDNFFNDLCHQYENIDNRDIIIDDRRKDIYQNVSFCQEGCTYKEVDYNLMSANCICDSSILGGEERNTTENKGNKEESLTFKTLTKSFISNMFDFNVEVIYCYNLVFNDKILVKNIGFYSMSILIISQIIFLCIFIIKKLEPIKNYMTNFKPDSKKNHDLSIPPKKEYIRTIMIMDTNSDRSLIKSNNIIEHSNQNNNDDNTNNYKRNNESNMDNSKKSFQSINNVNNKNELYFMNLDDLLQNQKNNKNVNNENNILNLKKFSQSKIMFQNNLVKNIAQNHNYNNIIINNYPPILNIQNSININLFEQQNSKTKNKLKSIPSKDLVRLSSKRTIKEQISGNKDNNEKIYNSKSKNKIKKDSKGNINCIETYDENLKDINNSKNNIYTIRLPLDDDEIMDMDFENAIIYDKRTYLRTYWSSLVNSQVILETFCTDNHLNLLVIKLSFFVSIFQINFFLNAFF